MTVMDTGIRRKTDCEMIQLSFKEYFNNCFNITSIPASMSLQNEIEVLHLEKLMRSERINVHFREKTMHCGMV